MPANYHSDGGAETDEVGADLPEDDEEEAVLPVIRHVLLAGPQTDVEGTTEMRTRKMNDHHVHVLQMHPPLLLQMRIILTTQLLACHNSHGCPVGAHPPCLSWAHLIHTGGFPI